MRRSYPSDGVNEMVTKEMICAAHDICLKKGDFVLSASLLERIYLAMRDKADGRDSAGWDAYEDLRKASDEMVLNLRQRVQDLEKQRDELLKALENTHNALKHFWPEGHADAIAAIASVSLEDLK